MHVNVETQMSYAVSQRANQSPTGLFIQYYLKSFYSSTFRLSTVSSILYSTRYEFKFQLMKYHWCKATMTSHVTSLQQYQGFAISQRKAFDVIATAIDIKAAVVSLQPGTSSSRHLHETYRILARHIRTPVSTCSAKRTDSTTNGISIATSQGICSRTVLQTDSISGH